MKLTPRNRIFHVMASVLLGVVFLTANGWGQAPPAPAGGQPPANAPAPANSPASAATEAASSAGLDKRIDGPVMARNQDLQTILTILQQASGMQMVLGEGINKKVTFSLENPTVRNVLETVLPANGLDYAVMDGGIVRIDTTDKIGVFKQPEVELMQRTFSPIYIDATELEEALTQLKSPQGSIILDNRSQKIIVEDTPESIQAMEQLINQLDVEMETRLFELKYANAEEVADQLQGVLSAQEGKLLIDSRNNRLVITDTPDRLDQAQAIIESLDVELRFDVIPLAFALPEDVMPLAESLLTENGYIDFDPRTSRIIIQDIPSVVDQIKDLITSLDIPTQQVWIEADIVQVNNTKALTLGTQASFGSAIGTGDDPNAPDQISSATSGFYSFDPFLVTGSSGLTLMDVRKGSYRFQIDAMISKSQAQLIASPRLMVQDGEVGSFTLGSEEPYAVRQSGYYYGSSNGNDTYTQQVRQVGTTMNLEVYASEAGYVEMYISMEDTSARRVELTSLGEALAVDGSFIETAVTVKSGRTVVLGGIINRSSKKSNSGVPILSSIPILGNLFKKKSDSDDKQKLLVFITPRIVNINDPFDFTQIDNYQRMRDLQNKGVSKFTETNVDDKFLDWSNEKNNEQEAIQDALQKKDVKTEKTSSKKTTIKQQMDDGIIRVQGTSKKE